MHGPESDNMIAPQLSAELGSGDRRCRPSPRQWRVSEHSNGRGQFDAGISLSGASLRHAAWCCMCAAEGEVTRAVQLILRQGQICNTENWHLHWDLEIEKDGNITLISKQLLLLCCFPSGRAKAPQLGRTLPALCWLVFTSPHFSQNWQKSSQPSQLSPGSDSEYSHFSSGGYGIDISMDGIWG